MSANLNSKVRLYFARARTRALRLTSALCAALACALAVEPGAAQTVRLPPKAPAQKPPAQPAPPAEGKPAKDKTPANCTQVNASVVSEAYGYKHVVTLRNGCERPVECQVWTDVDPTPRNVLRAQKGETVEIVTRIGSPASDFKALKECKYM